MTVLNSQHYPQDLPQQTTYTVQSGDTLYAIAWYTGNDYADLAKWNNLTKPYDIYPGQLLDLQPSLKASKKTQTVNKMTGPTSKKNTKKSIDQRDSEAYCDCEPDVNTPKSSGERGTKETSVRDNVSKKTNPSFPPRVERWQWPAQGRVELTNSNEEATKTGLDIYAQHGSQVNAAAAGKVVYAGNALRGYGNLIIIKHTDSFLSAYAHNSRIVVKEREWVNVGQQIAEMGDTGTTSVKLHFEIRYRGKAVEPMKYLPVTQ
ncbi:peptidoglycan DD-metalloendopeptidase family protein [Alteromonas gilva]|uniref:Peptidoglycan DD-metalloendopeptidase family protein n=1 Tax=Alteromonas gilva TaxID=2987522 RepID=A0ABT5L7T0_9ALTE|nr:peptidoglycan DD-metalloendopeptidase family protein [Alteromonas gilva]MDC8833103.1 peptidoglycan DD-metalloendopeptidase family protein [Alteromonas gilva]